MKKKQVRNIIFQHHQHLEGQKMYHRLREIWQRVGKDVGVVVVIIVIIGGIKTKNRIFNIPREH